MTRYKEIYESDEARRQREVHPAPGISDPVKLSPRALSNSDLANIKEYLDMKFEEIMKELSSFRVCLERTIELILKTT